MPIPSSGPISLFDIQSSAGGTDPISITEYYKGGTYIDASWIAPNVPTSGEISIGNFYGAYPNVIGQAVYTTVGTYSWVCPANVYSISIVCVGAGGSGNYSAAASDSSFSGAAGTLTGGGGYSYVGGSGTAFGSLSTGTVGGGNGGNGGTGGGNRGGGGAGGYQGNGGGGANAPYCIGSGGGVGVYGGTGGGAGGGYYNPSYEAAIGGAGVNGGSSGGSSNSGGIFGGGAGKCDGGYEYGGGGGGLRYVTSYATVPGNTYTVVVGGTNTGNTGRGAVRMIWGVGRAYPATNTPDQ